MHVTQLPLFKRFSVYEGGKVDFGTYAVLKTIAIDVTVFMGNGKRESLSSTIDIMLSFL